MKCPRRKFIGLDYSKDIETQQKEICQVCSDFTGKGWGEHCKASLVCIVTGKRLGAEAFEKLPKTSRGSTTHTVSDEGRKQFNEKLDQIKKQQNRPLW